MDKGKNKAEPPELVKFLPKEDAVPSSTSESQLSASTRPSSNATSSTSAVTHGSTTSRPSDERPEDSEEPGDLLSNLSSYFYKKLGLGPDQEPVHVLDEPTVDGIVRHVRSGKCRNVIAMIGAGISTAAGIPDFRSPNSGIYSKLGRYNLPSPEAVFEIGYFRRNPSPFYALARQLFPKELKPTLSHYFLRLLHEKGLLLRIYTQNIDSLERVAGIPAEKIVEAHGTFHTSHCINTDCNQEFSLDWLREKIETEAVPLCPSCSSPVKPDIVFFGERLPDRFFQLSEEDFARCDLLIIIGTSLQVQPFAGLVDKVHNSIPRLLINLEKCGQGNLMSKLLGLGCGLDFDSEANFRDVALIGTCDQGCSEMAERLGWKDELAQIIQREDAARTATVEAAAAAAAEAAAAAVAAAISAQQPKPEPVKEPSNPKKADMAEGKPGGAAGHQARPKSNRGDSTSESMKTTTESDTTTTETVKTVRFMPAFRGLFHRRRNQ